MKIIGAAFLMICLFSAGTPRAHAQFIVEDPTNFIQNTLTALSSAALEEKELVWDGLFFDIAQQALEQMTTDMIEWVNSGFDGEPVFITDLEKYFTDVLDDVAGEFVYGEQLSTVCTPFRINVVTAIAEEYQQQRSEEAVQKEVACTVDSIEGGNQQAFLSGSFTAGGWSMWFETVLNPQNTPVGAKLAGKLEFEKEALKAMNIAKTEADYGDGVKSQKVCNGPLDCTITTPGSLIKDQITKRLNIPIDRLLQADEMNEVIGALFGNLANEAVMGVNGLLGLGGNTSFTANVYGTGGNLSYLDAVREERANTQPGQTGGNKIEEALRIETQVLELQLAIVTELDQLSTEFLDAREPFEDDSCWALEFPESLSDKLDELLVEVPETIGAVVKLEALLENYDENAGAQAQMQILQQLSNMQRDGELSGRTAVIQYDFYLKSELRSEATKLREDIDDEVDSC